MGMIRPVVKRPVSPWLNLFWLFLFFPVIVIFTLLWYHKMPWLEGPPRE